MALTKVSAGVLNIDDLYGFRNRIINGAMDIDQRNAGASITPVDTYTLDRWEVREDTDGAVTCQRVADAPTNFINSMRITVTSTDSSLTGTQRLFVRQPIEGNNVEDLNWGTANARPISLSFWVKSSVTGTYGVSFGNSGNSRNYVTTYTINVANTWEYKTLTIPGDTSGTWLTDNGMGLGLFFALAMGPDYNTSTVNAWQAGVRFSATGATSLIATSGATWQLTGVQVEVGSVATPFERRPIGLELQLCMRYYESSFPPGTVAPIKGSTTTSLGSGGHRTQQVDWSASFTSGTINGWHKFVVPKRNNPSMTLLGTSNDKCIFYDFGTKAIIYPGYVIDGSNPLGFNGYNDGVGLTSNSSWGLEIFNWSANSEY